MIDNRKLTKEQMLFGLAEIGRELALLGETGFILICGGASMCIVHGAREETKDIDAIIIPYDLIEPLIKKIAKKYNWREDWLNNKSSMFFYRSAPRTQVLSVPGLNVFSVTPDFLLAMKLLSCRTYGPDKDDIKFLGKKLQFTTVEQFLKVVEDHFELMTIPGASLVEIHNFFQEQKESKQSEVLSPSNDSIQGTSENSKKKPSRSPLAP